MNSYDFFIYNFSRHSDAQGCQGMHHPLFKGLHQVRQFQKLLQSSRRHCFYAEQTKAHHYQLTVKHFHTVFSCLNLYIIHI